MCVCLYVIVYVTCMEDVGMCVHLYTTKRVCENRGNVLDREERERTRGRKGCFVCRCPRQCELSLDFSLCEGVYEESEMPLCVCV